nr:retrovirus-related Pol polyprotein from transposon TNT 1-94 [Tanacetum cinerariifolium]
SSHDDGFKPSSDDEKKVDEDLRKESECNDHEMEDNVKNNNNVNTACNVNTISSTVDAAGTSEVNAVGRKISIKLPFDPKMHALEDDSIFDFTSDDEDDGAVADINNLDTTTQVSPILTTRIHKDYSLDQVIGDLQSATQTRKMKNPKRLFLAYASFKDFVMYRMDVKSAFLYGMIKEEVYVCQPPGFEDPDFPDIVYKVEKALYGLHQAPRAWYETLLTFLLDNRSQDCKHTNETQKPLLKDEDGKEVDVYMYRYQVNPKASHIHVVKRIFKYLKGQPKLGLWYPKDSPFDLVAYTDSDYAREKQRKVFIFMMEKLFGMELELIKVNAARHNLLLLSYYYWVKFNNVEDEKGVDFLPNSTIFEQLTLMGKPKRKDTQVPQPSDPIDNVLDEAVHKELGDSLVRAATTASSLEAQQDSGGGPWCQEAIGDTTAQTRFESVSKYSNDSLLTRGNTLRSDEDSVKLDELIALCTTLQNRVLVLEKTRTTQHNEIASLKRRVKKLEKKNRSRSHRLKSLYKVGLTARVESFGNKESLVEFIITAKLIIDVAQDSVVGDIVSTASDATTDQIWLDEEAALKLQAAFDKEERLKKIDDEHQLDEKRQVQEQEQEELSIAENAILFQQLLEKRRKHFVAKREKKETANKSSTEKDNVYLPKEHERTQA